MNMNQNPTTEELRALLAPCDDTAGNHVLWVKTDGEVLVTRFSKAAGATPSSGDLPGAKLRFPAFVAGNEYVGQAAAADDDWIADLFAKLQKQWSQAKSKPNIEFAEAF